MQIDSGDFGIVAGVNRHHYIYCRVGISWRNPKGKRWRFIKGRAKYISAGSYGHWVVNRKNSIYFRLGVRRSRPQGIFLCSVSFL